jgi:glycosyltransferase involved in cell wall biosynthesis
VDPADARVRLITDVADLGPYYERSSVFVNPMQNGASVKVKTLNAAANGLPIVTTPVGNEGTGFVDGRDVIVRDTPESFAEGIRSLLVNGRRRRSLAAAGHRFLIGHYDHKACLAREFGEPAFQSCPGGQK